MSVLKFVAEQKQKAIAFARRHRLDVFKDVALFIIITLVIHYAFRYWAGELNYAPVGKTIHQLEGKMADVVYRQSAWFVHHVLPIEITTVDQINTMYFSNNGRIIVNRSCSGFKQVLQFALLILVFPGLWKRKLWFIPLGILVVHLTNLFRIIGLSVVIITLPQHWDFSHDYVFRPFFYVVIFMMWVWWVEKIGKPKTKKAAR